MNCICANIANSFLLMALSIIVTSCEKNNDNDIGMDVFKSKDYKTYSIIKSPVVYSARMGQYEGLDEIEFESIKVIAIFPEKLSAQRLKCRMLNGDNMVAPPESWSGLHRTLGLGNKMEALAYVGIKDGKCDVIQISFFKDGKLYFNGWKEQKPLSFSDQEAETYFSNEFNKRFFAK